jgi:hypothetical protein
MTGRAMLVVLACLALSAVSAGAQRGTRDVQVVPASLTLDGSAMLRSAESTRVAAMPADLITAAKSFLGVPYVHGGDSRFGMDCSGLVYRMFHDILGMNLPRGVDALFRTGQPATAPLHVGDLVFFDTSENPAIAAPTHVGVYAGGGKFVHAASEGSRTGVIVSALDMAYYKDRFLGARRVFPWRPPVLAITVTDDHRVLSEASPFASREPLAIDVYSGMTGGGPLDIAVLRDGRTVLAQRIAPGSARPSELRIVPDAGTWTVRINRIFKGRELMALTFVVEE